MRTQEQTRGWDGQIVEIAEGQHGVVGRGQLLDLGMEPGAIGRRIRARRLHPLHPAVYAVGHRVVSREGRWMAAVLACGKEAVLSHHSAAALWGIRPGGSGLIHVTSPSKSRSQGSIRRHFSVLPADEVTECDGIPITTVPRTILDLAAVSRPKVVEAALRQAEYLQLHDRLSLPHLLTRHPGRRGNRAVRAALARRAESTGRTRSALEERFLSFLDRHGLPRPQLNALIEAGRETYEIDCLWPSSRQIVELDGWQGHGTRSAFRDDRTRDRRLQAAGYHVTRLTWSQLNDEPETIAGDLRALLAPSESGHHRNHLTWFPVVTRLAL
jgi:very-short-patch-repair endonuclease